MLRRKRFIVQGQVQGVGFRPFVFSQAEESGLTGFVRNSPRGVVIEVQGDSRALRAFASALESRLPPLARITCLMHEDCETVHDEKSFIIAASSGGDSHAVLVSPDIATCADCLADIATPGNRRHGYAFTNCTNCGPRYSITHSIPYDRATTSMACFPMCPDCLAEYQNPRDRRFHAQPNACERCGPEVVLLRARPRHAGEGFDRRFFTFQPRGNQLVSANAPSATGCWTSGELATGEKALEELAKELLQGRVAAIKGLGGFHIACDACDEAAVALLRGRKNRPHKPFAVMAGDISEAKRFAVLGREEEQLLASHEKPVVICGMLPGMLANNISPDTATIGLMLPYTPLHSLLFAFLKKHAASTSPLALVMTSGNPGGEPICLGNREAIAKLSGMADIFLLHNRDILVRVDDSVQRVAPGGRVLPYRRARGFVPGPVSLAPASLFFKEKGSVKGPVGMGEASSDGPQPIAEADSVAAVRENSGSSVLPPALPCVLGVGPELKNTLCFTKGDDAFVSQHIGDMSNLETAAFHTETREHMAALLKVSPALIVRDLHPDYLSSSMAREYGHERGIPVLELQHHFAHAHAVLAEHAFAGKALVLALDGTGLGEDGVLWGGEVLYVDCAPDTVLREGRPLHERLASLSPLSLPGGEAAIREPWRLAHALLLKLGIGTEQIKAVLSGAGGESDADAPDGEKPFDPPLSWLPEYAGAARLMPTMLERGINSPISTSCGRLFDAVSALLGLCNTSTYEGQAAIRLEEAQEVSEREWADLSEGGYSRWMERYALYPCPVKCNDGGKGPSLVLESHKLFASVYDGWIKKTPIAVIARSFHASLAAGLIELARNLAGRKHVKHIALSGGCMQNMTLAFLLEQGLAASGLTTLPHRHIPPGDACISLGQAAWGRYVLAGGFCDGM